MGLDLSFYKGKKVLITGHTGFKGTWLSKMLEMAGADVTGYSLPSPTKEGARIFKNLVRKLVCILLLEMCVILKNFGLYLRKHGRRLYFI